MIFVQTEVARMLELPAPIVIVNRGSASKLKVLNCLPALNATVVQKQATLLTTDPMATFIALMAKPSVALRALALAPFARSTIIVR